MSGLVNLGGGGHWALEHREVILKSQILKILKCAQSCSAFIIAIELFQTVLVPI